MTKPLRFRCSDELEQALRARLARTGQTASDYLRSLVAHDLEPELQQQLADRTDA